MRSPRAFTLVEMIVALAVTSVLVVLMLQMFMNGARLWQSNDERLDTFREARAALQLMSREFSGMSPAPGTPTDFPLFALRHHDDTAEEDQMNHEIYGILPARNGGRSDLCAVGYFCKWEETKKAFVLNRQVTESNTTFGKLRSALSATAPLASTQAFTQLYSRVDPGDPNTSVSEVASYLWDFKVLIPDNKNPGQTRQWPQGAFSSDLPQWMEISFKAIGVQAARKLATQPITRDTWFDESSPLYQRFILPAEQQFITRVKLCR